MFYVVGIILCVADVIVLGGNLSEFFGSDTDFSKIMVAVALILNFLFNAGLMWKMAKIEDKKDETEERLKTLEEKIKKQEILTHEEIKENQDNKKDEE